MPDKAVYGGAAANSNITVNPVPAAESVAKRWVPDHWLIITRRRFRWHWELRNLVGVEWASGKARTFEAAREAGEVRAKIGPTGYLPERPNPGIPEAWPRVNYLPIKGRHFDGRGDGESA